MTRKRIHVDGSVAVQAGQLQLAADRIPAQSFGYFLVSRTNSIIVPPGGATQILCLGGPIVRLRPTSILPPFAGLIPAQALLELDTTTLPFVLGSGASVHFQYWYVDPAGPPGGNFTNSLVVTFCG